jgi:Kef-type K+ transport system membrane component KefB
VTDSQLEAVIISLAIIVAAAHLLGHVFERLRQPRLIGETSWPAS